MYEMNSILVNNTLVFTNFIIILIENLLFSIEVSLYYFELFYIIDIINKIEFGMKDDIYYYDFILPSKDYGFYKINEYIFNLYIKDSFFTKNVESFFIIKNIKMLESSELSVELNSVLLNSCFFYFIFFLSYYYIGDNIVKYYSKIKIFKTLVKEVDQEFSNFEDFFFWVFFISSLIIYSFNYVTAVKVLAISLYTYLTLILATILFIPFYIICVFLNDLSSKIRGYSKENSNYVHSLLDYMTFTAFCLRFILQSIRWVLIICTYILFHEYFFEVKINMGVKDLSNFLGIDTQKIYKNDFKFNSFSLFRLFFEYLDVLFVAFVQTVAFFVVILWLFNFLFSYSSENWFENFLYYNDKKDYNDKN